MAVDVVVVNYHTPDDLDRFIKSYHNSKFDGCTLTVVDVEVESEPTLRPNCDFHSMFRTNVGYGYACNSGAASGTNDVILLANADTLLNTKMYECYNALMAYHDWGVLGPRQVNFKNKITAGGIIGPPQSPRQRGWNELDVGQYSDIITDASFVSGALYFIKRSVWQELTNCSVWRKFHEDREMYCHGAFLATPHYYEDTVCSYHARAHGYKCVFYGPVQMIHEWHQASPHGGWADQQFAASRQMARDFARLHGIVFE